MCKMLVDQIAAPRLSDMMHKRTLTVSALAQYLGVSRRTLYNMIGDGRFPVQPVPGTQPRRWNVEAVDAWRGASVADA